MLKCCRCNFIFSWFDNSELGRPSNETLLCVAFVSFMGWSALQAVVALIAKSDAMMGDCAAMAVDALTYGFNLCAERKKNQDELINQSMEESEIESLALTEEDAAEEDGYEDNNNDIANTNDNNTTTNNNHDNVEWSKLERQLQSRKRHLHLEIIPPVMSVTILMVVISVVLHNAIQTLILDLHRSEKEQSIPDLDLMFKFTTANLVLDLVNVTCFARANHLMGYKTGDNEEKMDRDQKCDVVDTDGDNGIYDAVESIPEVGNDGSDDEEQSSEYLADQPIDSEGVDEEDRVNLNMCSAYTHVFADTLRSIAVIIATIIARTVDSVTPEVADATAAVIVSLIIFLSLVPLFRGLINTWYELRSIAREELALLSDKGGNDFEVELT
mmetsp:Transcript_7162/g.12993  ORF Transcript_7162/g.12993 Transcript_7162/m.12993 type:complete len:385 (-) Transcript_7162:198-1352(-)